MSAIQGPSEYTNRLVVLAETQDGWGDYCEGKAPKEADLKTARIMCEHLSACSVVPYMFPMLEGGVQMEWSGAAALALVVEIQDGSPELRVLGGGTRETMAEVGELLRHIYIAMVLVREARAAVLS